MQNPRKTDNPRLWVEATLRQGTIIKGGNRAYQLAGDPDHAIFKFGSEGVVQLATDLSTGHQCRIKCFWDPSEVRYQRSEMLVRQRLADLSKERADALAGAPYEILLRIGDHTPFALVMKEFHGSSWKDLKERAGILAVTKYPPSDWPSLKNRATWAYGLATAVLNMERRSFIHADISDGNVMVTNSGPKAGDMALVDFDAFVHPGFPFRDTTLRGSEGYAAPEIWDGNLVGVGSDRIGMAILIQEFLIIGDPDITAEAALGWRYDQQNEICSGDAEAHPHFADKYSDLAKLVVSTLRAKKPEERPPVTSWRPILYALATGASPRTKLATVTLMSYPLQDQTSDVTFGEGETVLDLSKTHNRIRCMLERTIDGSMEIVVQPGATVQLRYPGKRWEAHTSGERAIVVPGMILYDPSGKTTIRVDATAA